MACEYCDTLHEVLLLPEGKAAHCTNCGKLLYQNRPESLQRAIALGVSVLLLTGLMMFFPFISLDAKGVESRMGIVGAVVHMWEAGSPLVSLAVGLFVLGLPIFLGAGLLFLCLPLSRRRYLPGMEVVMRLLQATEHWVMVEVFFLGALVSLLKLVKLAKVELEIGFWSMAGLMVCLAGALAGIDRLELWDRIEHAKERRER
ncbi:MAG: paraquat-inducible protein A [Verrucomicrobiota bacterium JB023]|nr:paraquat-inducible protein A [Verrucomicrobiota bacterium JB023]